MTPPRLVAVSHPPASQSQSPVSGVAQFSVLFGTAGLSLIFVLKMGLLASFSKLVLTSGNQS